MLVRLVVLSYFPPLSVVQPSSLVYAEDVNVERKTAHEMHSSCTISSRGLTQILVLYIAYLQQQDGAFNSFCTE